jgi:NAD(P)-dependent dehydrogenase (short-subunit alcohol dehydrogenase family)
MNLQLKDKLALITGSTAGIGYAIAKQLAHEGAKVIVNGRTQQRVDEAVKSIIQATGNQQVTGIIADFNDKAQIDALLAQVPEVDILINNVAIFEPKAFADISDEDWLRFYEINVLSGVRLSRVYFDKMLKKNWGRIIFISSETDFFKTMRPTSLIQRFLSTDEVANMVTYLSSPLASATNGAAILAEGGLLKGAF